MDPEINIIEILYLFICLSTGEMCKNNVNILFDFFMQKCKFPIFVFCFSGWNMIETFLDHFHENHTFYYLHRELTNKHLFKSMIFNC